MKVMSLESRSNEIMDSYNSLTRRSSPRSIKYSSSLFVPRASVIRHTEEFKIHHHAFNNHYHHHHMGSVKNLSMFDASSNRDIDNINDCNDDNKNKNDDDNRIDDINNDNSNNSSEDFSHCRDEFMNGEHSKTTSTNGSEEDEEEKKEEKDSGVDESFDDEEEKNNSDETQSYDSDQSLSGGSSEDTPESQTHHTSSDSSSKSSGCSSNSPQNSPQNAALLDLEQSAEKEPENLESMTNEKASSRFIDYKNHNREEEQFDSVRPLLAKDLHLAYLLQLYRQADNTTIPRNKDSETVLPSSLSSFNTKTNRHHHGSAPPSHHSRRKSRFFLKEHLQDHHQLPQQLLENSSTKTTNFRNMDKNPLVDFSIMSLQENRYFSKNNHHSHPHAPQPITTTPTAAVVTSPHEQITNHSLLSPTIFSYGYDNAHSTLSPRRDANINSNGDVNMARFLPDYRPTIYNGNSPGRRSNGHLPRTYEHTINQNQQKNNNGSQLQCEYCHKKFNNEDAAKRHLLTHKGKRTHKCTHCSRSFYEQASFLRHLKSHSGEKAHKCEQCSMAFSKRSALEVHIRTHTGERPFLCKYCGKGFSISGNLHRHVLIHTGHRPYKCGKCPRAFNNPSHLARHISSFHA